MNHEIKNPLLNFTPNVQFTRDKWGDEFAHCIARITIGWGSLEGRLFRMLYALDYRHAEKYITVFCGPRKLAHRKKIVLQEIRNATKASYPGVAPFLEKRLDDLQSIQDRRNILAHGIWIETDSSDSFAIQPLGLQKDGSIEEIVTINHEYLTNLILDMDKFSNALTLLGAEMMAHRYLIEKNPWHVTKNTFSK